MSVDLRPWSALSVYERWIRAWRMIGMYYFMEHADQDVIARYNCCLKRIDD